MVTVVFYIFVQVLLYSSNGNNIRHFRDGKTIFMFSLQLPPGPCHVADLSGSTVYDRDCPEDYECNTQAIQYDFQGRSLNYHMCQYPSEKLEYFVSNILFSYTYIIESWE